MHPGDELHRYPVVGALGTWPGPVLTAVLAASAWAAGAWVLAGLLVAAGALVTGLGQAVVVQVGPAGLARGLVLGGVPLGWTVAIPWRDVIASSQRAADRR